MPSIVVPDSGTMVGINSRGVAREVHYVSPQVVGKMTVGHELEKITESILEAKSNTIIERNKTPHRLEHKSAKRGYCSL